MPCLIFLVLLFIVLHVSSWGVFFVSQGVWLYTECADDVAFFFVTLVLSILLSEANCVLTLYSIMPFDAFEIIFI